MTLLTKDTQDRVIKLLVDEGLADPDLVKSAIEERARTRQPLMAALVSKGIVNNDMIAHATAVALGV